jgi:hypothetical protein
MKEIEADCTVIHDAARKAQARLRDGADGRLEACAYELARLYNVLEKVLERICSDFENHFDKRGDYHERLLQRLALALPGIRPAFIPPSGLRMVRELKGFRHVVRHAYDLEFREDRLTELASLAGELAERLPEWSREFAGHIRAEQGWT